MAESEELKSLLMNVKEESVTGTGGSSVDRTARQDL